MNALAGLKDAEKTVVSELKDLLLPGVTVSAYSGIDNGCSSRNITSYST